MLEAMIKKEETDLFCMAGKFSSMIFRLDTPSLDAILYCAILIISLYLLYDLL